MTGPVAPPGIPASVVIERLRLGFEAPDPPLSLSTGLVALDDLLHGLRPGRVYVLGGRHGVGKSALVLGIAKAVLDAGKPVLYRSLDMTADDIVLRLVAMESYLPVLDIQARALDPEDWPSWRRLRAALDHLAGLPLAIDSAEGGSGDLRLHAEALGGAHGGLGLVVIDDLQRLALREVGASRSERVEVLVQRLRSIALACEVPVVACAQCAPPVRFGDVMRPPDTADLRDSDAIAGNSDVVMLLAGSDAGLGPGLAQVRVFKNRHGLSGAATLAFIDHIVRFSDVAWPT